MKDDPFSGVSDAEMEQMISRARLGRKDGTIARMKLIDRETDADIAAAFEERDHISRTTVGRRMKRIIAALNSGQ